MIHNKGTLFCKDDFVKFHEIMTQLAKSSIDFFQSGSRFYGGARSDSDWDFFAEYTVENSKTLKAIGFQLVSVPTISEHAIKGTVELYRFNGHQGIDIQLVNNLTQKKAVNDYLYRNFRLYAAVLSDPIQRFHLWNKLLEMSWD